MLQAVVWDHQFTDEVVWDKRYDINLENSDIPLPFVSSVLSHTDEYFHNQIIFGSPKEASNAYFIFDGPKQDWTLRKNRALTRAQNEGSAILWLDQNELSISELEQWLKSTKEQGYRLGFVSEAIAMQRHHIYQHHE